MGKKHPPDCKHCEAVRRPHSPEWRANLAAALTNNPNHGMKQPGVAARVAAKAALKSRGRKHPPDCAHCAAVRTTGEGAYSVLHRRLQRSLPRECAMADATCKGQLEVALRYHDGEAEIAGFRRQGGAPFSLRDEDYWRLCRSHHARYDMLGH